MRVFVLVNQGVFDTGLSCVLDTLAMANLLGERQEFRVEVVAAVDAVKTTHGFAVPAARASSRQRPDLVVAPALGAKTPVDLDATLALAETQAAADLLVGWQARGAEIAGACTATFLLAHAGILDGRRATTTWWLAPAFRRRFPGVDLAEEEMLVHDRRVTTAGAALAHVDLALWMVRRRSPALAGVVARHLLLDGRPSQAAYTMPDHLQHADPLVEKFERYARGHLAGFNLAAAAKAVGASERSLERRLRRVLGRTVIAYVQDLRVAAAVHRLETTSDSLDTIANLVGYKDAVTLRTLLRKKTGRGVRELRRMVSVPKATARRRRAAG